MRRDPGLSVTARTWRVLEAFSAERPELALSEIARRAGLPLTTAHRLVGDLTGVGALERDRSGRYRIGLRLWELGSLAPRGIGLRQAALPYLEDLYEATHANVHLAVLDDGEAVYVERISGRGAVEVVSRVGGRLPLHATGVGLVLLAFAEPGLQERILSGSLRRYTPRTIASGPELRRLLAEVRRSRVAVVDGLLDLEALSVAAPLFGPDDRVVGALSIVVHSGQSAGPFVPAVTAAARGVSRALGSPTARGRPSSAPSTRAVLPPDGTTAPLSS